MHHFSTRIRKVFFLFFFFNYCDHTMCLIENFHIAQLKISIDTILIFHVVLHSITHVIGVHFQLKNVKYLFFFEFRKTKNQLLNPIDLLCIIHHLKMSINLSLYFLFIFYFPLFLFPCTFDSIQSHNCQSYMKDEHYCNQRTHFLKYSGI